jgi:hypothetical protein
VSPQFGSTNQVTGDPLERDTPQRGFRENHWMKVFNPEKKVSPIQKKPDEPVSIVNMLKISR